jgi:hypothetical protein
MAGQLLYGENGRVRIELDGWAHRHLIFVKEPSHPQVLFALGAHKLEFEKWDARLRILSFSLSAPAGAPLQITLYSTLPVREMTEHNGESVAFTWSKETGIVRFDFTHETGARFVAHF